MQAGGAFRVEAVECRSWRAMMRCGKPYQTGGESSMILHMATEGCHNQDYGQS